MRATVHGMVARCEPGGMVETHKGREAREVVMDTKTTCVKCGAFVDVSVPGSAYIPAVPCGPCGERYRAWCRGDHLRPKANDAPAPVGPVFSDTYRSALRASIEANPGEYAYPIEHADMVASKILEAAAAGNANINTTAFRKACRAAGIKCLVSMTCEALHMEDVWVR